MIMIVLCCIGNIISFFNAVYMRSVFERTLNVSAAALALIYLVWIAILRIQKHKRHERINQLLDKN